MERTLHIGDETLLYQVKRSRRRRTVALRVNASGAIIVHAPAYVWGPLIDRFVRRHVPWILKKQAYVKERFASRILPPSFSDAEREGFTQETQKRLPESISRYAEPLGVSPRSVRVAHQTRRWGSCSSRGDLRFSWRMALIPEPVFDYIVIHELSHLKVLNHSPAFWALVASVCPDYKTHRRWLRSA